MPIWQETSNAYNCNHEDSSFSVLAPIKTVHGVELVIVHYLWRNENCIHIHIHTPGLRVAQNGASQYQFCNKTTGRPHTFVINFLSVISGRFHTSTKLDHLSCLFKRTWTVTLQLVNTFTAPRYQINWRPKPGSSPIVHHNRINEFFSGEELERENETKSPHTLLPHTLLVNPTKPLCVTRLSHWPETRQHL